MEYPLLKQLRDELDLILKNKDAEQQELPVCLKCGEQVDTKVVNFCKIKYQGKIYCRECQKEVD